MLDISNITSDNNRNISSITKGGTTFNYTYYGGTNRLQNADDVGISSMVLTPLES